MGILYEIIRDAKKVAFRGQHCCQIEFRKVMSKTHFHSNHHSSWFLHVDAINSFASTFLIKYRQMNVSTCSPNRRCFPFRWIANEIVTKKKGLTEPLPKQVTISSQKYTSLLPIKALCQEEVQT